MGKENRRTFPTHAHFLQDDCQGQWHPSLLLRTSFPGVQLSLGLRMMSLTTLAIGQIPIGNTECWGEGSARGSGVLSDWGVSGGPVLHRAEEALGCWEVRCWWKEAKDQF